MSDTAAQLSGRGHFGGDISVSLADRLPTETATAAGSRRARFGGAAIQPTAGEFEGDGAVGSSTSSGQGHWSRRTSGTTTAPRRVGLRPEDRAAIKSYHEAALVAARELVDCASNGDECGMALAVRTIDENVEGLWKCKKAREIDWQAILNHFRLVLKQALQEERAERMTQEECQAMLELVGMVGLPTRTSDDLNEAVRLIRDAGFDPYHGASHPDE